jgi:hypothetical protein
MAIISGETNQSFTATVNGSYAVKVTQNGCTDTSVCEIVNNVGIFENDFGNSLLIYPNPTNGVITIDFGSTYNNVVVIVRNELGQEESRLIIGQTIKSQFTIPGEVGIYFIEINAGDKRALLRIIRE